MQHTLTQEDFKEYVGLPKNFGLDVINPHQETAFRKKIFPYISSDFLSELRNSSKESEEFISTLIYKAAACYSVVIAIPFIKSKIKSWGIVTSEGDKTKPADWWDIRDMALTLVKIADECLSDALTEISKDPDLKSKCDFYKHYSYGPIPNPEEFNKIYSINKSMDMYILMVPLMQRVWLFSISSKIKGCTLEEVEKEPVLSTLLKESLVYYSLGNALSLSQFTFISSGVVFQYEELPWQKSVLVSDQEKLRLKHSFLNIATDSFSKILEYIKENKEDFPCYQENSKKVGREIIERKSGLYM
ncbi:DUF6712 family protein [Chryseobacterium sp. MEBOG07]|uniref:DUF6712 family protein n=1 Tax=Chryseobacterium sp. MEBOG07 TaxID=2879939 RepID=UPI001F3A283E|nr:DUF6712 family protein [Chryseobacterium sp. MEBOG07]UKB81259.1 hypothetical protein LF886_09790 [Chryseobacterium sp. MEBOG07]